MVRRIKTRECSVQKRQKYPWKKPGQTRLGRWSKAQCLPDLWAKKICVIGVDRDK